jgi:hypothetical protein
MRASWRARFTPRLGAPGPRWLGPGPGAAVLSAKTIANNVSNILAKLQVAERSAAIVAAREAGLGRGAGGDSGSR